MNLDEIRLNALADDPSLALVYRDGRYQLIKLGESYWLNEYFGGVYFGYETEERAKAMKTNAVRRTFKTIQVVSCE